MIESPVVEIRPPTAPSSVTGAANVLVKPTRKLKKVFAAAIKPPQMVPDESGAGEHVYYLVYVTEGGDEHREPCTFAVWKKCQGYPTPNSKEPTNKGYKGRLNYKFLVGFPEVASTGDGPASFAKIVSSVDMICLQPIVTANVKVESLEGLKTISLHIDPYSGEVEVISYPQNFNVRVLPSLIASVDKCDGIHAGMHLPGDFEVYSVSGTTLEILPPAGV